MVTAPELEQRRQLIETGDLQACVRRLEERAARILTEMPVVPQDKALLSADGGFCPDDGTPLGFDPWSPRAHRCPRCGRTVTGERHDLNWARFQHLWLAERAAHLATLAALTDNPAAADRSGEILAAYGELYFALPNRDNVLGPSHLFFSTYLESIWLLDYLAAATLLRETGKLDQDIVEVVDRVADEAANLIGEFNEGFSNRQTWNSAALVAAGSWFGDEDLVRESVEGRTGLIGHLMEGFGEDGLWFEGENYHLFALRGLLIGLGWARYAGGLVLEEPELRSHVAAALRAPTRTALPDLTFPARRDSRFGVSLAQPMYLELWEAGQAWLPEETGPWIGGWLDDLYRAPAQPSQAFDSWLHEAGEPVPSTRSRADLSWWAALEMAPVLETGAREEAGSARLPTNGLVVLRSGDRYASLECGTRGGGHGHADRLHLTLHAGGTYWLPDFGTGSYVNRDLIWYRSTLAHNAPRLNGRDQPPDDAVCDAYAVEDAWAWTRGILGDMTRTLVAGPEYLVDSVGSAGTDERLIELPWHLQGDWRVETPGDWETVPFENEFVTGARRFRPAGDGPVAVRATGGGATLGLFLAGHDELLELTAPGLPGSGPAPFLLQRARGRAVRLVAVLDPSGAVRGMATTAELIEITTAAGVDRQFALMDGWQVESGGVTVRLGGKIIQPPPVEGLFTGRTIVEPVEARAIWVEQPPALDGTELGFVPAEPLALDTEDQYRRSEEPWAGPEEFSASAWVNWSEEELYLMVEVVKPEPVFRPAGAPPLRLDNEPDDIHSDGLQLYLRHEGTLLGFLIVPETAGDGLRVRPVEGTGARDGMVRGHWQRMETGYRVTLGIRPPWEILSSNEIGFDLAVNEMQPERVRRAGQLIWTGGNGWIYLLGDRQDPRRLGRLILE